MLAKFAWLYSHVRHIVDHSDSESTFMCTYRTLFLYCWPRACQETLLYCVYNSCSCSVRLSSKSAPALPNWENCTLADTYLFYVRIFLLWYVSSFHFICSIHFWALLSSTLFDHLLKIYYYGIEHVSKKTCSNTIWANFVLKWTEL